jgi:hypothetical protein
MACEGFTVHDSAKIMGCNPRTAAIELKRAKVEARGETALMLDTLSQKLQNGVYDALVVEAGGNMLKPLKDDRTDRTFNF